MRWWLDHFLGGDEGTTLNIVMCDYHLLYEGVILVAKKMRIKFQKRRRGENEESKDISMKIIYETIKKIFLSPLSSNI